MSAIFRKNAAVMALVIGCLGIESATLSGENRGWQAGTILGVKLRMSDSESKATPKQYISVKVGKTIYVALYIADKDQAEPDYYIGMQRTVLVDGTNLKVNDLLGRPGSLRILSWREDPPKKK